MCGCTVTELIEGEGDEERERKKGERGGKEVESVK